MALNYAEYPLLSDHFLAYDRWRGFALFSRHVHSFRFDRAAARPQSAKAMRHFPDSILIRDQDMAIAPGEPIRCVEAFGMAFNEISFAVAIVIAEKRQIANLLLRHDHIALWQHQEAPRMGKPCREGRDGEAFRCARL